MLSSSIQASTSVSLGISVGGALLPGSQGNRTAPEGILAALFLLFGEPVLGMAGFVLQHR